MQAGKSLYMEPGPRVDVGCLSTQAIGRRVVYKYIVIDSDIAAIVPANTPLAADCFGRQGGA